MVIYCVCGWKRKSLFRNISILNINIIILPKNKYKNVFLLLSLNSYKNILYYINKV